MNQSALIQPFMVNEQLPRVTPMYTSLLPPLSVPSSLMEICLKIQNITFSVLMDNRQIQIIIQNPLILAQLVSDGMRMAIKSYNNYLWMMRMFHLSDNSQPPVTPFFHIPTWENPIHP